MGTIGYGDYFPKTFPGRIVAVIAAIVGVLLSSLLIVSLTAYLTMQGSEVRAHTTLLRLSELKKLQD